MNYLAISILFSSVLLGGLVVHWVNVSQKTLRMLLSFSGAFLLSLAFTKIIPNIFSSPNNQYLGYFVLLGFFIQIIMEYFSKGLDHGHSHSHSDEEHKEGYFGVNPYGLFIAISLHAFFEGMPFSGHFHGHEHVDNLLLLGIVIHKIPIAIVIMSLFLGAGYSKSKSFIYLLIFAFMAPMGSLMSYFAGSYFTDIESYYKIIMALVVGIFFHIATVILYEGDKGHKFNIFKFLVVLLGIFIALLVSNLH